MYATEQREAAGGTFQYLDKDSYDPERVFADSFGIAVEDKYPVTRIEVSLAPKWLNLKLPLSRFLSIVESPPPDRP